MTERVTIPSPLQQGIGTALARSLPLPKTDAEAKLEKHLTHRLDLHERVRS